MGALPLEKRRHLDETERILRYSNTISVRDPTFLRREWAVEITQNRINIVRWLYEFVQWRDSFRDLPRNSLETRELFTHCAEPLE